MVPGHSPLEAAHAPPMSRPLPFPAGCTDKETVSTPHTPACLDGRKNVPGLNQRFPATACPTLTPYFGTEQVTHLGWPSQLSSAKAPLLLQTLPAVLPHRVCHCQKPCPEVRGRD